MYMYTMTLCIYLATIVVCRGLNCGTLGEGEDESSLSSAKETRFGCTDRIGELERRAEWREGRGREAPCDLARIGSSKGEGRNTSEREGRLSGSHEVFGLSTSLW